jgi:hypothetical protein
MDTEYVCLYMVFCAVLLQANAAQGFSLSWFIYRIAVVRQNFRDTRSARCIFSSQEKTLEGKIPT